MGTCLVIAGVLFLAVAALALIGAIVFIVMARKRSAANARPATVPTPIKDAASVPPATPAPAVQPEPHFDPNATVAVPMFAARSFGRVVFTAGPLAGASYDVTPEGFWIGRSEPAQIVIAAPSISKQHVWIGVRDDRAVAIDQASTNGTFINGVRLRNQQALSSGDEIVLADGVARARFET